MTRHPLPTVEQACYRVSRNAWALSALLTGALLAARLRSAVRR